MDHSFVETVEEDRGDGGCDVTSEGMERRTGEGHQEDSWLAMPATLSASLTH